MMDAIVFDTKYRNLTANKTARLPSQTYVGVLLHDTASPSPDNSEATLKYNLDRKIGSSYHFLISRSGIIYAYLDPAAFTAWHAGESQVTIDGDVYRNFAVNVALIGVEIDSKNDGTPVTAYQLSSLARLALFFRDAYGIPLDREHYRTHAEVALPKGRKTDPRSLTPEAVIAWAKSLEANEVRPMPDPLPVDYAELWGTNAPYRPDFGIVKDFWMPNVGALGAAQADEGELVLYGQRFEGGFVIWEPEELRGVYVRQKP